jgi:hypothetical protein
MTPESLTNCPPFAFGSGVPQDKTPVSQEDRDTEG